MTYHGTRGSPIWSWPCDLFPLLSLPTLSKQPYQISEHSQNISCFCKPLCLFVNVRHFTWKTPTHPLWINSFVTSVTPSVTSAKDQLLHSGRQYWLLLELKVYSKSKKLETCKINHPRDTETLTSMNKSRNEESPRDRKVPKLDCNLIDRKKLQLWERSFSCKPQSKSLSSKCDCFPSQYCPRGWNALAGDKLWIISRSNDKALPTVAIDTGDSQFPVPPAASFLPWERCNRIF